MVKDEEIEVSEDTVVDIRSYIVKVQGEFLVRVQGDNPDYLKGVAEGQIRGQLPAFQVRNVTIEEVKQ